MSNSCDKIWRNVSIQNVSLQNYFFVREASKKIKILIALPFFVFDYLLTRGENFEGIPNPGVGGSQTKSTWRVFIYRLRLYSWFHKKGTLSVHSFNGEYLSISEGTGSCGYLFHEIPGTRISKHVFLLCQFINKSK